MALARLPTLHPVVDAGVAIPVVDAEEEVVVAAVSAVAAAMDGRAAMGVLIVPFASCVARRATR